MLAKIGNAFAVTGMFAELFDLWCFPHHAGMGIFKENRDMVGNTNTNDLCSAPHGSIAISELHFILFRGVRKAVDELVISNGSPR